MGEEEVGGRRLERQGGGRNEGQSGGHEQGLALPCPPGER